MNLGIGLSLTSSGPAASAAGPPTLSSLNYSQVDTLGGGADVVATGSNLASATAVTVGGTAATITGTTATTVTFTAPAKAAGSYDVVVTTPLGAATLAASLTAWNPATETGCTLLAERPNYSNTGSGAWTARAGSNVTGPASFSPAASSGAPVLTGLNYLDLPTNETLFDLSSGAIGSISGCFNASSALAPTATPGTDPTILGNDPGSGADFGVSFSTSGVTLSHTTSGGVVTSATRSCGIGAPHAFSARFSNGVSLQVSVDGSAFASASTPVGALPALSGNPTAEQFIGGYFGATSATLLAIVCHDTRVPDSFAAKLYAWSQQRHGVT